MTDPQPPGSRDPGGTPSSTGSEVAAPAPRATASSRRRRAEPKRPGFWSRLPWSIKAGVPLVVVGLVVWDAVRPAPPRFARLAVGSAVEGREIEAAKLTVFPFDDSSNALWPREALATFDWAPPEPISLGEADLPGEGIVRVDAEGFGAGFVYLTLAEKPKTVAAELGPPGRLSATVKLENGQPAVDARVVGLGGGARGVPLCETRTDPEGRFVLEGFDARLHLLSLHITLPGHGVLGYDWYFDADEQEDLTLVPTQPIRGSVVFPGALAGAEGAEGAAEACTLYVRGLPGVTAELAADGSFVLDGVPAAKVARLLIDGLPAGWTYHQTIAKPGASDVAIEIAPATTISGRVVLGESNTVLPGAAVYHDDGPRGGFTVIADEFGQFELRDVPPGTVEIRAQVDAPHDPDEPRTYHAYSGSRTLEVTAEEPLEGIIIRVR